MSVSKDFREHAIAVIPGLRAFAFLSAALAKLADDGLYELQLSSILQSAV